MIVDYRFKKPFIHLGFNRTQGTFATGENISIYLKTLYNQNVYEPVNVIAGGATINKVSEYQYDLVYIDSGAKSISVEIESKPFLTGKIQSNIININVENVKADTIKVTADTTLLTADYF